MYLVLWQDSSRSVGSPHPGPEPVRPFPLQHRPPTPTTGKVPGVLGATECGGCSLERWKNKLLKGLFPCSEYFYKAYTQGLSPHTQIFLSFLTRSSGEAFGDSKWRQGGGSSFWLWGDWLFWEPWVWFGQRTFLGEEAGVRWKQLAPLSMYFIQLLWPAEPQPFASQATGAAKRNEAGIAPPSMPVCHGRRPQARGFNWFLCHVPGRGHDSAQQISFLFSHTDQSLGQMGLVGGWLKSQKGQSCVGAGHSQSFQQWRFSAPDPKGQSKDKVNLKTIQVFLGTKVDCVTFYLNNGKVGLFISNSIFIMQRRGSQIELVRWFLIIVYLHVLKGFTRCVSYFFLQIPWERMTMVSSSFNKWDKYANFLMLQSKYQRYRSCVS